MPLTDTLINAGFALVPVTMLLLGLVLGGAFLRRHHPHIRCTALPLDRVQCCRRIHHPGNHAVRAEDVQNAGYERKPF